ncbi:MAG: hypothetical protein ABI690_31040 [Chloroflexota bacterium]
MIDPEFDPQEQDMINRLTNAPQPSLNPDAFEAIRARMLDAMDMPAPQQPHSPISGRQWLSHPPVIAAIIVSVLIVSSAIILLTNQNAQPPTPTSIPTIVPTFTLIPPTSQIPTETMTSIPTPSLVPEVTESTTPEVTATIGPVIVVEGPVEAINDNVITIYGVDITINPDDPILATIQVGDVLHVEADYATNTTTIVAVTVEPVTATPAGNEVNVNPSTGESWKDDGSCSHPPPPWAPANGWRRRCGNTPANGNPPGNGNGNGNGNGKGNGNGAGKGDG